MAEPHCSKHLAQPLYFWKSLCCSCWKGGVSLWANESTSAVFLEMFEIWKGEVNPSSKNCMDKEEENTLQQEID